LGSLTRNVNLKRVIKRLLRENGSLRDVGEGLEELEVVEKWK
jgi:hypothetical protein